MLELSDVAVDAEQQRAQLAARFGGVTSRDGCTGVGPLLLEGGPRLGESPICPRQLLCLGFQRHSLGLAVGQVGGQTGGVGLQRGDDRLVDEGAPLPVDASPALAEHCHQALGLLPQGLEAAEGSADIVATSAAEIRFGCQHRGVEVGEVAPQAVGLVGMLSARRGGFGESPLERGELSSREEHLQRPQLSYHIAVPACRIGLTLERTKLAAHFAQQVLEAGEVSLGGSESALGLLLPLAELEHARRLLEDEPAFLGAGVEDGVDLALAHDDVLLPADARVGQQLLDVE